MARAFEFLECNSKEQGILQVTLNRPLQLNALNQQLLIELKTLLADVKEDRAIKARLIGKGRAMELCLTGKRISADLALSYGLITELVDEADLMTRGITLLKELSTLSPFALNSIMRTIDDGYNLTLTDALAVEATYF